MLQRVTLASGIVFCIVLTLLVAMTGFVAVAPTVHASPEGLLEGDDTGCGHFHYHSSNVKQGQPPSLHYHQCY